MNTFLKNKPVNKKRISDGRHLGRYIALAAAITQHHQNEDVGLILAMDATRLPKGHAQYIYVYLLERMCRRADLAGAREREDLTRWAQNMPELSNELKARLERLSR
jgi:hypothetical protein